MKRSSVFLYRLLPLLILLAFLPAVPVHAGTCSNPTGNERDIIYNSDYHTYQFCNGTKWFQFHSGLEASYQATNNPTIPAGSGFFVLSHDTYNGNLGDLSGADAACLSDLTTNTGWKGYATANSRGELNSSKVHAFLCDSTSCTKLTASTTYYFANAANSSAGGATFTTDSNSQGPNDNANWAAANYFSGTYTYWTGNGGSSATAWSTSAAGYFNETCQYSWSTSSGTINGYTGTSSYTNASRWQDGTDPICSNSYHLICFVNP
jgi:hypothetical protein